MGDFCCKHHYAAAKAAAWSALIGVRCGCDHNESCNKCFPPDFKEGGKFNLTPDEWEASQQAAADRRAKRNAKYKGE